MPRAPAWLSLSCADAEHPRGEAVDQAAGSRNDRVVAVGVNCTAPEHVGELVSRAVAASGKPAVAYPNSGETWDGAARTWGGDGAGVDAVAALRWMADGAGFVGGCCRVGPAPDQRARGGTRRLIATGGMPRRPGGSVRAALRTRPWRLIVALVPRLRAHQYAIAVRASAATSVAQRQPRAQPLGRTTAGPRPPMPR